MHHITNKDGVQWISVFFAGHKGRSTSEAHPNFKVIVDRLKADPTDSGVMELFDVEQAARDRFESLGERFQVKDGRFFIDGVEARNSLTDQIIRFLYAGNDLDWQPLVKFYENLLSNPNKHSREQLYNWLDQHNFTIDQDGYLIGYKAVYLASSGDHYTSTVAGYAIINGVEHTSGFVPYRVGDVVTMPRDKVQHDPSQGCSHGLHVGTHNYASSYTGGNYVLRVKVNPRDVVSVPTDSGWAKLRCCRFEIIDAGKLEVQEPLVYYGRIEADELPRLIPASQWKAGDQGMVEIDISEAPEGVVDPVNDATDDPACGTRSGRFSCAQSNTSRINYDSGSLLFGTPTGNPAQDTPRIDSTTVTYHDLSESDEDEYGDADETEYCSLCGERWCEGECGNCPDCGCYDCICDERCGECGGLDGCYCDEDQCS